MKTNQTFTFLASTILLLASVVPAMASDSVVPATSQPQAQSAARLHAGRHDPMQNIGVEPFPHVKAAVANHHNSHRAPVSVLKPPPPAVPFFSYESPAVADEPKLSVIDEVQLVSLMDEHAIIRVPATIARKFGWPTTISLNPGEHIGSLKLIATSATQATFEEDGLRQTKPLAP